MESIEQLVEDLGMEEAISYIRFALPRLAERRDALLSAIAEQNWANATQIAHKTLGSIRIYDDGGLEAHLKSIENHAVEDTYRVGGGSPRRPLTEPCLRVRTRLLMPDLSTDSFQTNGAIAGRSGWPALSGQTI